MTSARVTVGHQATHSGRCWNHIARYDYFYCRTCTIFLKCSLMKVYRCCVYTYSARLRHCSDVSRWQSCAGNSVKALFAKFRSVKVCSDARLSSAASAVEGTWQICSKYWTMLFIWNLCIASQATSAWKWAGVDVTRLYTRTSNMWLWHTKNM